MNAPVVSLAEYRKTRVQRLDKTIAKFDLLDDDIDRLRFRAAVEDLAVAYVLELARIERDGGEVA